MYTGLRRAGTANGHLEALPRWPDPARHGKNTCNPHHDSLPREISDRLLVYFQMFDLTSQVTTTVPFENDNCSCPCWASDGAVYFISDRSGSSNGMLYTIFPGPPLYIHAGD